MDLPAGYDIGPMQAQEVAVLRGWAASEGWNPGLHDLQIVWDLAPESFIALRRGDELVGGGSILNYAGQFGFMGLFIMRADHRGQGLGQALWHWRRDTLLGRLDPGSSIAMDGVFDMVPFYRKGGFEPAYQVLRYEGSAHGSASSDIMPIRPEDLDEVIAFDRSISKVPRSDFLKQWLFQTGGFAMSCKSNDGIIGFGAARPCDTGFKIGPLFAETPAVAQKIAAALMANFEGEQIQIDVPEPNQAGLELVQGLNFKEVFGCTRLYLGAALPLPLEKIFSVTSLEFG
jgi:GNAT superfamily N-acetyltransferase